MKVSVSYSSCTMYSLGTGGMDCPLCGARVPDGERHVCDKKPLPTKALSIRAPWWWFILHGGKDIDILDCISTSDSPWFFGEYGFVLANPVAFARPVPCKGALGFFTVPADVLAQIEAQR